MTPECQFFFVGPDGVVRQNPRILPLDVVLRKYPRDALVLRFAFDSPANALHVQDASFRRTMEEGDPLAWNLVNQALATLEEKTGKRFPERRFGDPQNSGVVRVLSDYRDAWRRIDKALREEAGVGPVDMTVYEYAPFPGKEGEETVSLLPRGSMIGATEATEAALGVNRMLHKAFPESGVEDVDWGLIQDALAHFYLSRMRSVMKALPPAGDAVLAALDADRSPPLMFAMDDDGRTRAFKAKGDARDEQSIRERLPGYEGPLVLFRFEPSSDAVAVSNHLLSPMYEDEVGKRMTNDILDLVSRESGRPREAICMTFDPALSRPWHTRLSRVEPLWGVLSEGPDMDVLEVPFKPRDKDGVLLRNPGDEPEELRAFRAARGLDLRFPAAVVDGFLPRGRKLGILSRLHESLCGRKPGPRGPQGLLRLPDDERADMKRKMLIMLEIGMSPSDVLDFFSDRSSLPERVAYREVMREAVRESAPRKIATAGIPIGINQWWWPSVPEGLKEMADDAPEPLNGPEDKDPPVNASIEVMLERDRDPLQSQKPTELQLRQNRI